MSRPLAGAGAPRSSPHSSDEASHHGTPSTNLTAFSPDDTRPTTVPRPKFNIIVAQPDGNTTNITANGSTSTNDPFFNAPTPTSATSARSQLSPTALAFTPGQYTAPTVTSTPATNTASRLSAGSAQAVVDGVPLTHGRVSSLVASSTPEAHSYPYRVDQASFGAVGDEVTNVMNAMHTVITDIENRGNLRFPDATTVEGSFTTDEATTRAFMVHGIAPSTSFAALGALFNAAVYPSLTGINAAELTTRGVICVGFTDTRDGKRAYSAAQHYHPEWNIVRLSPRAYAQNLKNTNLANSDIPSVSDFEGQLILSVYFDGRDPNLTAGTVFQLLRQTLATFGEVKALHSMPHGQGNVRDFRVEYFDTRAAENACRSLNQALVGDLVLSIEHYRPDVSEFHRAGRPYVQLSVTGRSTIPFHDPANIIGYVHTPRSLLPIPHRGRGGRHDGGANHNQVDVDRIRLGLDVRTTIMLRNIPNKIDQAMLKKILDETSRGCYDFMYLRIDFANNCNVGYAFINFIDALAIIPFALARAGQRWNRFNSDKVAEISYATIQGKDCLVQKFRNSSVMLEHPTFRPKLYNADTGPDAGEEEMFPGPDNPSKMRRSVENAEHVGLFKPAQKKHRKNKARKSKAVRGNQPMPYLPSPLRETNTDISSGAGLFAPRQGQVYREEQRRRRSQFDRGTPGAEFEAHSQGLSDPASSAYPTPAFARDIDFSPINSLRYAQAMPGAATWYPHGY